jgi:hypothetical protein
LPFDPLEAGQPDPADAVEFPPQVELIAAFMEAYFEGIMQLSAFELHTYIKYDACASVCCQGPRLFYRKRIGPKG